MSKGFGFLILLVVIGRSVHAEDAAAIRAKSPPRVHDIGSRPELFVDDALVERLVGKADFRLQHPTPRGLTQQLGDCRGADRFEILR